MLDRRSLIVLWLGAVILTACDSGIPKEALELSPESLARRQLQTRLFDTKDEKRLLGASAAVLQDLGFNLDESETDLGVVVASKERDATEAGQVVRHIVLAILGVYTEVDKVQKIRVSLVTRSHGESGDRTAVRATFQRMVWNERGQVSKTEPLDEPKLYQEFFDKLSKSVFLQAHGI